MSPTLSTVAFVVAAGSVLAVALGFFPVKPWLYIGGGLLVTGFVLQPSSSVDPGTNWSASF